MQPTFSNKPSRPTFADKLTKKIQPLSNFEHPTEEQGLIFNHLDGTKIREYLIAIYQLVGGAANIVAASRVSGGRVIIFLGSKELVESFQQNHGGFKLHNTFIKTRKLKTPAVKLVLSNISPIVPNADVEKALKETLNLKLASPVSILRVSPQDDLFPHVVSWRRQVYVHSTDDNYVFPSSFILNYAERSYRIFLNADNLTCFKCSTRGHKAENCPQIVDEEFEDDYENTKSENPQHQDLPTGFPPLNSEQEKMPSTQIITTPPSQILTSIQQPKRGPSTLDSSNHTVIEDENTVSQKTSNNSPIKLVQMQTETNTNQAKRLKTAKTVKPPLIFPTDEISKINNKFEAIQLTKPIDCQISAKEFMDFLSALRNSTNKLEFAKSFNSDLPGLMFILDEMKPLVSTGAKRTITSLVKILRGNTTTNFSSHSDTD